MGNNFYAQNSNVKMHIGKASYGWEFIFEAHPDSNIFCWEGWWEFLTRTPQTFSIVDDEGRKYSFKEFDDIVNTKKRQERYGEGKLANHFDELQKEEFEKRMLLRQQRGLPFTDVKLKDTSVCNVWKDADGYAVVLGEFA